MTIVGDKRRKEIPKDSIFWEEKASVQRGWIYADRLVEKPPVKLARWMKKEGIEEIPPRDKRRYVLSNELKKLGVWEEARAWRTAATKEMLKWNYELLTLPAARELVWRIIPQKIAGFEKDAEKAEEKIPEMNLDEEVISGMEFLPGWMRWCVLHPGLMFTEEQVMEDTTLDESCQKYVELYPCPHQAAMNQFILYRGDKKLIDGLFKEIGRLHIASVKAGGAEDKEKQSEETVEQQSIKTLASILKG